ncbi:MAG: transketolase [Eubacteriaceae bacterium]|nr:transketolase [Eubacteriaceae bacterium]
MNLKEIASNVRVNIINQTADAQSGHPGGSLSGVEILTLLQFEVMNIPSYDDPDRDRFVLSKGHASPLLYGVLEQKGVLTKEDLKTFRKINTHLQGHPDMNKVTGVDMTAGSLGLGICAAVGMALAGKLDKKDYRVYSLLGDGEIQEGTVWEAFMSAAHYDLDNLCVIIDNNGLQIDGKVSDVMSPYPIKEKMEAFGFNAVEVDGHSFEELRAAFENAKNTKGRPTAIIAHTVKGKGVSFMENNASWHGSAPNEEQRIQAIKEIMEGSNE